MAEIRCKCDKMDQLVRISVSKSRMFLSIVLILCLTPARTFAADINCANVRYRLNEQKGLLTQVSKEDPKHGEQLQVCLQGPTCCTQEMENRLFNLSREEFDRAVHEALSKLATLLRTRATKFDDFFKKLLSTSKQGFHEMFKKTYGIIYEQHSYVFTDLFGELERYYAKGNVALAETMENFFNILYQKMFTVLNSQYQFDDNYLRCVSEHMDQLRPFGDVPHKLSVTLRRSFVATRTFSQALTVASEVVERMVKIPTSMECVKALTKMTGCPACQGLLEIKACNNYCINVMKGCLAYHAELDNEWNMFVDAMEKISDRILGPFNIEMVVHPIDIKISEAIMNFQENGHEISQTVFTGCGKPVLGHRRVRDTAELLQFEPLTFSRADETDDNGKNGPALTHIVLDIKKKVNVTRQFWSHLPYQICNDDQVSAGPSKDDSCWNGAMKARYEEQITGDGISNQQKNPEVVVNVHHASSILNEQIFVLKDITAKLRNAFHGNDVDWVDMEPEDVSSGSGSGEGSGSMEIPEGSGDSFDYVDRPHPPTDVHKDPPPKDRHRPHSPTSGSPKGPSMSISRAVASYLLPIVVMWFGGMVTDLL